jgi:hypothetical protein
LLPLFAAFAADSGDARPSPAIHVWTVPDLYDALYEQNNKVVLVRGWLIGCQRPLSLYSRCALYSTPNQDDDDAESLTLGWSPSLWPELRHLAGNEVILRVRALGACHEPEGPLCLEASTDVVAYRIVKVFPAAKSRNQ